VIPKSVDIVVSYIYRELGDPKSIETMVSYIYRELGDPQIGRDCGILYIQGAG